MSNSSEQLLRTVDTILKHPETFPTKELVPIFEDLKEFLIIQYVKDRVMK